MSQLPATTDKKKDAPSLQAYLQSEASMTEFQKMVPQHLTGERFQRMCLTQVRLNPDLAKCDLGSVMKCMLECASMGLEPGRHYHFIPFKRNKKVNGQWKSWHECTGIIDWKGLVVAMLRHPDVLSVYAEVVKEGEEFEEVSGLHRNLIHKKIPLALRTGDEKVIGSYAVAHLAGNQEVFVVCDESHFKTARETSRSGFPKSGPWVDHEEAMKRKTAVRRLSSWVPQSSELAKVIDEDDKDSHYAPRNVTPDGPKPTPPPGAGFVLELPGSVDTDEEPGPDAVETQPPANGSGEVVIDQVVKDPIAEAAKANGAGKTVVAEGALTAEAKAALAAEFEAAANGTAPVTTEPAPATTPEPAATTKTTTEPAGDEKLCRYPPCEKKKMRADTKPQDDGTYIHRGCKTKEKEDAKADAEVASQGGGSKPASEPAASTAPDDEALMTEIAKYAQKAGWRLATLLPVVQTVEPDCGSFIEASHGAKTSILQKLQTAEGVAQLEQIILAT